MRVMVVYGSKSLPMLVRRESLHWIRFKITCGATVSIIMSNLLLKYGQNRKQIGSSVTSIVRFSKRKENLV